jgi:hypothetical protein
MAKEIIEMYKYDKNAPDGKVSFGAMTADDWKNEIENQGFVYTPEERNFVQEAIASVMRGDRVGAHHRVVTQED